MLYPHKLTRIQDGLELYVPDPERVKSVYEKLLAANPGTPFPFWAKIWPSAKELSSFLKDEQHWVSGKHVLELGAGIGAPSFLMAPYASTMIISDHATEAVALIEKNIQHLGLKNTKAMCLHWNCFPNDMKAETVLLSDINYDPDQFGVLLELIRKLLAEGSTIILSTPQRITINPFAEALQPFIKRSVLRTRKDGMQEVDIRILILSI
ncbi:MAG: hypothetical protein ABI581_08625 [Sediminibacterium sp.]